MLYAEITQWKIFVFNKGMSKDSLNAKQFYNINREKYTNSTVLAVASASKLVNLGRQPDWA